MNTLLKLWPLFTADKLQVRDATEGVTKLIESLTLDQLFDQGNWPELAFFALIQPDDDILPVRTIYGGGHAGEQTVLF